MAETALKCMPQFLLQRIPLPATPVAPWPPLVFAFMCGANSMRRPLQLPNSLPWHSLPPPPHLPQSLYVNMQIAARIFCTSLNRTVCQSRRPAMSNISSLPLPVYLSLPASKRCSICNVNWTTAVAIGRSHSVFRKTKSTHNEGEIVKINRKFPWK